jgi:predicted N-acyltransferase
MDGDSFSLELCDDISRIAAPDWDSVAGTRNPFVCHAFLAALEAGKAVGGDTGWDPLHLVMRDDGGKLLAAMPHYLKHHSYGEYIFDHSWANGFMRAGGQYYPKMLAAIPFTPATGPRLLTGTATGARRQQLIRGLANGMAQYVDKLQLSSAHINFLPLDDANALVDEGWLLRHSIQFHWHNDGYQSFDDFLASLSSRKRKNIRKERQSLLDAGVQMLSLTGAAIKSHHIDDFYRFYMSTIDRKWGGAYLTREVFEILHATMADRMLLVMAEYQGRIIGGALNFIGETTLYGRNWGADLDIPNLHFEACYYQAIDYAITNKLSSVEAGAQGFHKVQRGYLPVKTWSVHWIAHSGFKQAVSRFLMAEERGIDQEANHITMASPFKRGGTQD